MRDDLPTGTVTLLLTDIEGSTRLLDTLGATGYATAQARHRDMLRRAASEQGGVEVDTQGDAFFFVFPTAAQAVRAAAAGQRELAGYPWPHAPVRVRMGMHTGTPERTEEGYVGLAVNLAARIAALGHGGQVLVSTATADSLPVARLEVTLRSLGEHRLKDIEEPQRLHQLVVDGLDSDFPALRSREVRPNNLPTPLTPFIGRGELVVTVRELVLRPEVRVVSLLGPGGTGKSRLALRVATELIDRFADGAFFVGLASIRDTADVIGAIAASLQIREEQDQPLLETACAMLAERQILLVLDNFEQVQAAAADVGQLLRACPGLTVLVTSRQPLRLSGEQGVRVPGLSMPPPGPLPALEQVAAYEAIRLFVDRARAMVFDFELDDYNAASVVAICRKLDGLPIAIELAAARLYEYEIDELLSALEHRLDVLDDGAMDVLDHQRTLRDLIAWSYDMLEPELQSLWRRLAVFSGGCTRQTLDAVCNLEGARDAPRRAAMLVNHSLLNKQNNSASGAERVAGGESMEPRFTMLDTLREYALERLAESGELAELQTRHRAWCIDEAEEAEPHLRGPRHDYWLRRLDAEHRNLRAGLASALDSVPPATDDAQRIAAALCFYWYQRGVLTEGREWLNRALSAGDSAPEHRARALLARAMFERLQMRPESAEVSCQEALRLYRELGDDDGTARTLSQLGTIYEYQSRFEEAARVLTDALQLHETLGDRERAAFTLVAIGAMHHLQGDLEGAETHYARSLELGRALDDANSIATALVNLGEVAQLRGDSQRALKYYRESVAIYHGLNNRNAIAYCLEILAGLYSTQEACEVAALLFGAADMLRETIGAPVEAFNRQRYDDDVARVRAALGEAGWAEHWGLGRELEPGAAIERAQAPVPIPAGQG